MDESALLGAILLQLKKLQDTAIICVYLLMGIALLLFLGLLRHW